MTIDGNIDGANPEKTAAVLAAEDTRSPQDIMVVIEANVRAAQANNTNIINGDNANGAVTSNNLENISVTNYYSMTANTIPPYVIDRLSRKTNLSAHNNSHVHLPGHDDMFTSTFRDTPHATPKWGEFLNAIKTPNSVVPVKASVGKNERYYETGEVLDETSQIDDSIQPYLPSLNSDSSDDIADDVFKSYDLYSKWRGGHRLKGLFESPDSIYSNSESELSYASDLDDSIQEQSEKPHGGSGNDVDLEKGSSSKNRRRILKKRAFSVHRSNRERDIKQRAKYWIEENKKDWKPKLFESIKTNSYFPLFFRLFSLSLTSIALGLSSRIVKVTKDFEVTQQPSSLMAMIVQSVAILYLFYITYDEFTSQPLGLRDPTAKIRLILLDLVFIIFSSANLALSFQAIYDNRWVCNIDQHEDDILYDPPLCVLLKALTAFLFLTLVVWCINFSISVFRIVHSVSYNRDKI